MAKRIWSVHLNFLIIFERFFTDQRIIHSAQISHSGNKLEVYLYFQVKIVIWFCFVVWHLGTKDESYSKDSKINVSSTAFQTMQTRLSMQMSPQVSNLRWSWQVHATKFLKLLYEEIVPAAQQRTISEKEWFKRNYRRKMWI